VLAAVLVLGALVAPVALPASAASGKTYRNPLTITIPSGGRVESCADPTVLSAKDTGDGYWYAYCTTDPLNNADKTGGNFNFHLIPMLRSADLVNWTYMGDAFSAKPSWVASNAGLWAPEVQHFNGQYYLYYTASDTSLPGGGSAIGVATSSSPLGPWTDSGTPAVEPHAADCCPGSTRWVFDPDVVTVGGQHYIFYGSYFGGVSARTLSADGLHSDPASQVAITIANRYEGTEIVKHGSYYYLFASATNCCNGPLTAYSVFVGRSENVLGPYLDRDGNSLLAGRVGGTPALTMNGNRWVGTGHNTVFDDYAGQTWTMYHAVDQNDPYFAGAVGFTKRPALLDPVDWVDGWPTVRDGRWASDTAMPRPAAQPGSAGTYVPVPPQTQTIKQQLDGDEFTGTVGGGWSWVRQPATGTFAVEDGTLRFDTQNADLFVDSNNASVLTRALPTGNWVVETKVKLNVPAEGCCFNYVQAGLVVYGDDDNFLKLAHVSIWDTRQTEWAKELSPVPAGYPRYGNTVAGTPGEWTWLRIARWERNEQVLYQAFTSQDGSHWVAAGIWTHSMSAPRIGLVSMGGSGFTANFDYVRIYRLQIESSTSKK